MTTQTVTALELTAERPEMVRSIIELIMADTVANLVDDEKYEHLRPLLIQPREDIVEKYRQVTASIFLFDEYRSLLPLVADLVDNIGSDLFTDMLDTDENAAYSEILRCFGHGVSFWDSYEPKDFGFFEMPKLKKTFESPYDVALQILDKIAEAHPNEEEEDEPDNITTFQIPEHYLSLIFNGDDGGYEEEDIKAWEQFEQQMIADGFTNGHWSYPDNYESYFSHSNDVHRFGDNVVDLQWVEMST